MGRGRKACIRAQNGEEGIFSEEFLALGIFISYERTLLCQICGTLFLSIRICQIPPLYMPAVCGGEEGGGEEMEGRKSFC